MVKFDSDTMLHVAERSRSPRDSVLCCVFSFLDEISMSDERCFTDMLYLLAAGSS